MSDRAKMPDVGAPIPEDCGRLIEHSDGLLRRCACRARRCSRYLTRPIQGIRYLLRRFGVNINTREYWDRAYADVEVWRDFSYTLLVPILKSIDETGEFALLDVGCGVGDGVVLLGEQFPRARIEGADFSPVGIDTASKVHPRHEFFTLDATREAPPKTYDYILMVSLLEHLSDPMAVVERMLPRARKAVLISSPYMEVPLRHREHLHAFDEMSLAPYHPTMYVARPQGRRSRRITYVLPARWTSGADCLADGHG
jgi:SAM-dependent methyltransferase